MSSRNTLTSIGLLLLRVAIGFLMLVHGVQKVMGFSEMADKFPDPIGLGSQLSLISAIGAEVGCSLLLIFGLGTRIAAIPLAFTMIVALFIVHASDPWKVKELAAVYLSVYLSLVFTGAGEFSLDRRIFKNKQTYGTEESMHTS
jgi:putative oxidoreductase